MLRPIYPSPPDSDPESSKKAPRKRTSKTASTTTAKKPAGQRSSKKQIADKATAKQSDDKVKKSRKGKGEGEPKRAPPPPPIWERCHLDPSDFDLCQDDFDTINRNDKAIQARLPKNQQRDYGKIKLQKNWAGVKAECMKKLRELDALPADAKTDGLKSLIKGVRNIPKQSWSVLIVYFDFSDAEPNDQSRWSYTELKKLDVVEVLTNVAVEYAKVYERAKVDGREVCTKELDLEMSAFVQDVLALGKQAEGERIVIKEWEKHGTIGTLEAGNLGIEEILADDGSEDDDDNDDDADADYDMDLVVNNVVQSFTELKEEEDKEWLLHRAAIL